jgi:predicted nuclease with RNAse H fold
MTARRHSRVSVGVDVAEARKGLDLVALDSERNIVESRSRLTVDDVVEIAIALRPGVVCIDSPSGWSTSGRSRRAERQLAAVGIQSYRTPSDPGDHRFYGWMRVGFEIYDGLRASYPVYRGGAVAGAAAEIFPNATACLLAGELRPANTPKVDMRRQVLRDCSIPEHKFHTPDQIDAALGALTGLIALDGGHSAVGDPDEGMILLPVPALPLAPLLKRGPQSTVASPSPTPRLTTKSRGQQGATVRIGYVNRNQQRVIEATGLPGTDHGQSIYVLRCGRCGTEYGNNGSGNAQRKCPRCQGGAPGIPFQ